MEYRRNTLLLRRVLSIHTNLSVKEAKSMSIATINYGFKISPEYPQEFMQSKACA